MERGREGCGEGCEEGEGGEGCVLDGRGWEGWIQTWYYITIKLCRYTDSTPLGHNFDGFFMQILCLSETEADQGGAGNRFDGPPRGGGGRRKGLEMWPT